VGGIVARVSFVLVLVSPATASAQSEAQIMVGVRQYDTVTRIRKEPDPYATLRRTEGAWSVQRTVGETLASGRFTTLCWKLRRFFACEQVAGDSSRSLRIFVPDSIAGNRYFYRTREIEESRETSDGWTRLEIAGDTWIYYDDPRGARNGLAWRTINEFSNDNTIRFERQHSTDGTTWETESAGVERRIKR
jgi:hypothetical protein